MKLAALLVLVACGRTTPLPRPTAYASCTPMGRVPDLPEQLAAEVLSTRSSAELEAGDLEAALRSSLAALELARGSAQPDQSMVVYNRRVLTANTVNVLLSLGRVQAAEELLLAAAATDRVLGVELEQAAAALPHPMRCTPPD